MTRAVSAVGLWLVGWTAVLLVLAGCTPERESCFQPVSINPARQVAIIFDVCTGAVHYRTLPPLPAPPSAGVPSSPERNRPEV